MVGAWEPTMEGTCGVPVRGEASIAGDEKEDDIRPFIAFGGGMLFRAPNESSSLSNKLISFCGLVEKERPGGGARVGAIGDGGAGHLPGIDAAVSKRLRVRW